ncbi:MAG TPA: LemA family protein [Gammaproteobacteria bacterium]|jgi:LemA protein|nr:LemA family protein [Gammaproteobacteria bacterium]
MSVGGFVFWAVMLVAVGYLVMLFNGLVALRNNVGKAWANIDVLLKQRHDELPKLVETCKQYMNYERDTLEKVMQARAGVQQARESGDVAALGPAEGQLRSMIGKLYAVAEAYPQLKANESFQQLQSRISGLENGIADRREFYNESVNLYNTSIQQFPGLMMARLFAFQGKPLLEFGADEKRDVDMKALFT